MTVSLSVNSKMIFRTPSKHIRRRPGPFEIVDSDISHYMTSSTSSSVNLMREIILPAGLMTAELNQFSPVTRSVIAVLNLTVTPDLRRRVSLNLTVSPDLRTRVSLILLSIINLIGILYHGITTLSTALSS